MRVGASSAGTGLADTVVPAGATEVDFAGVCAAAEEPAALPLPRRSTFFMKFFIAKAHAKLGKASIGRLP